MYTYEVRSENGNKALKHLRIGGVFSDEMIRHFYDFLFRMDIDVEKAFTGQKHMTDDDEKIKWHDSILKNVKDDLYNTLKIFDTYTIFSKKFESDMTNLLENAVQETYTKYKRQHEQVNSTN